MIHLLVNSQHQVLHHRLSRLLCDPSSEQGSFDLLFSFRAEFLAAPPHLPSRCWP